jgi:Na+-transporting NADH:ubiquinone oxidoreductase subunit NqrB
MSAESATIESRPSTAERKSFKLDQRYVAPLLITGILFVSQSGFGVLESLPHTLTAIATAIFVEVFLRKITVGKFPHLASAYISGISVGILLRTPLFWPFAACAAISIASKYVLRWEGRHLWNPSNFGICMMLFLAHDTVATLSQQWDNRFWAMLVIWVVGSFIISRLKRFHICATYVLSFLFFAFVRGLITGQGFLIEAAPITGPMYQLFIFFMITDPPTTVRSKRGQILVAFCVAAMECVLRLLHDMPFNVSDAGMRAFIQNLSIHAPYFALFIVGPIANVLDIWRMKHADASS